MLLLVIMIGFVAHALGLTELTASVGGAATLGGAAFVGLVAASSTCLAAVGGLLLSVSATWVQGNTDATRWHKAQPLLLFNAGRLAGYFLLGGAVGLLGQAISPSVRATGVLMVVVAAVMLWLGLRMLELLPKSACKLPQHTMVGRRIAKLTSAPGPLTPLVLGALTFFLPCGFTQSMQLTALTTHSFVQGGLLMLAFALGTLPALLGISVLSTTFTGNTARGFFRFAGAAAVVLGLLNLKSGLLQTGVDVEGTLARAFGRQTVQVTDDAHVVIDAQGRQIINLAVSDLGYSPSSITIDAGKPTWVYATAQSALKGCATFLTAPAYNLSTPVKVGGNWLGPIENPQRDFVLTCSMGMLRADVHVRRG